MARAPVTNPATSATSSPGDTAAEPPRRGSDARSYHGDDRAGEHRRALHAPRQGDRSPEIGRPRRRSGTERRTHLDAVRVDGPTAQLHPQRPGEPGTVVAFSGGSLLNLAQGKFGRYNVDDVK